jgi:serine/threonine-protein kinase
MHLQREVALKLISTTFDGDPDRIARFEREAQLLAALNHPHIATVYGLEHLDGMQALAMELVDGETLATQLVRGPMSLTDALGVATQIADALQAAHEKGIIHRDLKPANVAVTPAGDVRVLDFGLAKALDDAPSIDAANSPTLTFAATQPGVILGTAAYMAPEQAKGRGADRRSDMWAFGCLLYEMLTGRRAFDGDDASDMIAAVLRGEPDWTKLPSALPAAVERLLRRCLEKDRRARTVDAGAALFVLRECVDMPGSPSIATAAPAARSWPRRSAAMLAALMLAGLAVGATAYALRPESPRVARFVVSSGPDGALSAAPNTRDFAVAPDGSLVVYRAPGTPPTLRLRAVERLETVMLPGTDNAVEPFFSPDGRWVAFLGEGQLRKVSVSGGRAITIAPVTAIRGGAWLPDDTIVFANAAGTLFRVPASGGPLVRVPISLPDGDRTTQVLRWPSPLPDGHRVLVTRGFGQGGGESLTVAVVDLTTGTLRDLFEGSSARYVSTGHVIYAVEDTLRAVPFDPDRATAASDSVPVADGILRKASGVSDFDISADGTLVYASGTSSAAGGSAIVSVDRQGRATPLPGLPSGSYRDVRFSPDGKRLAVASFDDIWTYDFSRATFSRMTTDPGQDRSPLWSRDGLSILFTSYRAGYPQVFSRPADGAGAERLLFDRGKDAIDVRANVWAPDGRLIFTEVPPDVLCRFGQLDVTRPAEAVLLLQDRFCSDYPAVSPDGHWIAYMSALSGRLEVYVERYPEMGARQQISTEGGQMPLWSADGRELFFLGLEGQAIFAVPTMVGATVALGNEQKLIEGSFLAASTGFRPYDVASDGRIVIIGSGAEAGGPTAPDLIFVQHWFEELKRLVGGS